MQQLFKGGNYFLLHRRFLLRKLFKEGKYSREDTIHRNKVFKIYEGFSVTSLLEHNLVELHNRICNVFFMKNVMESKSFCQDFTCLGMSQQKCVRPNFRRKTVSKIELIKKHYYCSKSGVTLVSRVLTTLLGDKRPDVTSDAFQVCQELIQSQNKNNF